ncbi:hypothetical protein Bca4012_030638 [Brassica carinata]
MTDCPNSEERDSRTVGSSSTNMKQSNSINPTMMPYSPNGLWGDHLLEDSCRPGEATTQPLGIVSLIVKTCDLELKTEFAVTEHFIPFDAISGRPWMPEMKAVTLIYHQCVKFISPTGEKTIHRNQKHLHACYMSGFQKTRPPESKQPQICDLPIQDPKKDLSSAVALDEHFPENASASRITSLKK